MSKLAVLAAVAVASMLTACAYVPPATTGARQVSADYVATGGHQDVRAYIYGGVTVIEFSTTPPVVVLRDAQSNGIEFERDGRFIRLPAIYDAFTVYAMGEVMTFEAGKGGQL